MNAKSHFAFSVKETHALITGGRWEGSDPLPGCLGDLLLPDLASWGRGQSFAFGDVVLQLQGER